MPLEEFALPTAEDVVRQVVSDVVTYIRDHAVNGADVHIALTGGTSGTAINQALLEHEVVRSCRTLHLWFSDERYVPRTHEDRNDANLESLIDGCLARVHQVAGPESSASVQQSAQQYASELHLATTTRFCSDNTMMDITMLGLGPDGHVASLFPHSDTLQATAAVIAVTDSPKPPPVRVTWTYPTINASRQVWLIATGSAKADAVAHLKSDDSNVEQSIGHTPALGVSGKFETRLYLDFAAEN